MSDLVTSELAVTTKSYTLHDYMCCPYRTWAGFFTLAHCRLYAVIFLGKRNFTAHDSHETCGGSSSASTWLDQGYQVWVRHTSGYLRVFSETAGSWGLDLMPDSSFVHHTLTLLVGGLDSSRSLGIVSEYYILPSVLPVFSKHNIVNFSALPTVEPESNRSFHL